MSRFDEDHAQRSNPAVDAHDPVERLLAETIRLIEFEDVGHASETRRESFIEALEAVAESGRLRLRLRRALDDSLATYANSASLLRERLVEAIADAVAAADESAKAAEDSSSRLGTGMGGSVAVTLGSAGTATAAFVLGPVAATAAGLAGPALVVAAVVGAVGYAGFFVFRGRADATARRFRRASANLKALGETLRLS
ncbi:hypothetical protein [Jiella sonneratiae]|uniref:Integral membrane protein n=1 Tax=Jiella sonneratiae TaxID=2816856 RepID=A0ABS3J7H5_9HYPH|nr:hypothetical protein [Jiella sonneratiae]MBO0905095.1 hypothetical protein [Jiella sonneratiae]